MIWFFGSGRLYVAAAEESPSLPAVPPLLCSLEKCSPEARSFRDRYSSQVMPKARMMTDPIMPTTGAANDPVPKN